MNTMLFEAIDRTFYRASERPLTPSDLGDVSEAERTARIDAVLSLVEDRDCYAKSHPHFARADAAAEILLEQILESDRLRPVLIGLIAKGAALHKLELVTSSAEVTLLLLAADAAAGLVDDDNDVGL